MSCLDASTASQFVEGVIPDDERDGIEAHLSNCSDCRALLVAIAEDSDSERTPLQRSARRRSNGQKATRESEATEKKWTSAAAFLGAGAEIGRFVIHEQIGHGGMGVVYRAHDPELDRDVAIKLLRFDYHGDRATEAEARLLREAQAMARLSHPNVVTVYDVGSEDGYVFVAMELLRGTTLGAWLAAKPRAFDEIRSAFVGAGRGLAAAHRAGLVHRDFKPTNVIVDAWGKAVVVDFGLVGGTDFAEQSNASITDPASLRDSSPSGSLTRTGAMLGTPAYMAPEQHLNKPLGPRTDQWAYAVCLYQALSKEHPFEAQTFDALREKVLSGNPAPLSKKVPSRLRRAAMRGLARRHEERFASMTEMVRFIEGRKSSNWTLLLGLGAIIAALATFLFLGRSQQPEVCVGGKARAASVWSPSIANKIIDRFAEANLSFGDRAASGAIAGVESYMSDWSASHRETCLASNVRKELSPASMDNSMACLDRRLQEASVLVSLLQRAEADVVVNAERAVASLSDLESCSNQTQLQSVVRPATSQSMRKTIEEVQRELARVKALLDIGRPREALELAKPLLQRAQQVDERATQAEAHYWYGRALEDTGNYLEAEDQLSESAYLAVSVGDSRQLVLASSALVRVVAARRIDLPMGDHWWRLGSASLESAAIAPDSVLAIDHKSARAQWMGASGDFKSARTLTAWVLDATQRKHGRDDNRVAKAHRDLSFVCNALYDFDCGETHAQQALEIATRTRGEKHPSVAVALMRLGDSEAKQKNYKQAATLQRRAVDIFENALGDTHPSLAAAFHNLCHPLAALGESEEALAACERSLEITQATLSDTHPRNGKIYSTMAYLQFRLKNFERSYELDTRALGFNTKALGADHAWIADAHQSLGRTRQFQNRQVDAAEHFTKSFEIRRKQLGSDHPRTLHALMNLGSALFETGELETARTRLEEALRRIAAVKSTKQTLWIKSEAEFFLAQTLWKIGGARDRAKKLVRTAIAGYRELDYTHNEKKAAQWLKKR